MVASASASVSVTVFASIQKAPSTFSTEIQPGMNQRLNCEDPQLKGVSSIEDSQNQALVELRVLGIFHFTPLNLHNVYHIFGVPNTC